MSYASQLVAQIADVANIAVGDNDYAFTTASDSIDTPGVLGLASAAPIYTCFLSTLWAQALSNPQQHAKMAVPSQDERIKLILLFEKRATDGLQFDYAELLVDGTNNLIAEVQRVAEVAGATAVGPTSAAAQGTARVTVTPIAPGECVTVEVVTGANGRMETRTVARREGGAASATTPVTATIPSISYYTWVQNGVTCINILKIRTRNNAFKRCSCPRCQPFKCGSNVVVRGM